MGYTHGAPRRLALLGFSLLFAVTALAQVGGQIQPARSYQEGSLATNAVGAPLLGKYGAYFRMLTSTTEGYLNVYVTNQASGGSSGGLTDAQLRASAVSVSVSNFPATQPISGSVSVSNFPASQAVTGPLTDTQLRATAVPVSVTFPSTQAVSGTISVGNFPATQAVSGTVSVGNFPVNASNDIMVHERATAAPGGALPTEAIYEGGVSSGLLVGTTQCDKTAFLQMTTATTTQMIALVSAQKVHVCGYWIQGSTTATATTLKLVSGTGTNCGTGQAQITPAWNMPASSTSLPAGFVAGRHELFATAAGTALCATSSAAGTVNLFVSYTQY